ncbi:C40 family peptidase [Gillisia sp. JM1]|uniref:C40 family peptidase n=1 Tax=Gillisia sp. JM1 TaxID=1283286 RepID=UPI000405D419|nr:SH3 domain-containing C40 family peptidase [Gillisia sp. JM1]
MRKYIKSVIGLAAIGLVITSCDKKEEKEEINSEADSIILEVKNEYVPDKRVALFEVESYKKDGKLIVKGDSNLPNAVNSLRSQLAAKNIAFIDSLHLLPEGELKNTSNAVVKISVANIRSNPAHSAELATQATMGTPLNVLKHEGDWYLVQTPDKYLAWVDQGGIQLMSDSEMEIWLNKPKLIFTNTFGSSFTEASDEAQVVSDLVAGNVVEIVSEKGSFYEVKYPSGTPAFIKKDEAKLYPEWIKSLDPSEENLVNTSRSLMGLPYLWGGTSSKGVDCSGFTKTIYFLNGIVLPRDASQQVHAGKLIDSTRNFEKLIPGDLLFFGRKATDSTSEKVVHVGMWIGDNQFIHSLGNVHISTTDTTAADFDEYNYNRYLRTKRILPDSEKVIRLSQSDLYGKIDAQK